MKKYLLKDGSIYWHKLYFDFMPNWTTNYSPPLGLGKNYAAYFLNPFEYFKDVYLSIKWFIQRGYRGYSDSDVWNWCHHMARINEAAIKQLAKGKMGHPIGLNQTSWKRILLRIADGFQAFNEDDDDFTSYKKLSRKAHLALCKSRQKRTKEGLKRFSKYFWNLWD